MKRPITINECVAPEKALKMDTNNESQNTVPMDVSVIVDHNRITKNSALSLVELAKEIEKANHSIEQRACTRLKMIADQVKYLQEQANNILKEAQRDIHLHNVQCYFVKQPGHIYHLYERNTGEQYFSLISPEEWGKSNPNQVHKGSYRLEHDQSWTPVPNIPQRDQEMKAIHHVYENKIFNKVYFLTDH